MECDVRCKCGKLTGTAHVMLTNLISKPLLAYVLAGKFVIVKREPLCAECDEPALSCGEWH